MLEMKKLEREHMQLLLDWRTQANIQDAMLTEVNPSIENQFKWFESISSDPKKKHWLITYNSTPIGALNLDQIDYELKKCSASFYIGEKQYSSLGAIVLPCLYNYVFQTLGFRKIYGSVVSTNKTILKIHQLHGYREVGYLEKDIKKNGEYIDVIIVELMADVWLNKEKYKKYNAKWH